MHPPTNNPKTGNFLPTVDEGEKRGGEKREKEKKKERKGGRL